VDEWTKNVENRKQNLEQEVNKIREEEKKLVAVKPKKPKIEKAKKHLVSPRVDERRKLRDERRKERERQDAEKAKAKAARAAAKDSEEATKLAEQQRLAETFSENTSATSKASEADAPSEAVLSEGFVVLEEADTIEGARKEPCHEFYGAWEKVEKAKSHFLTKPPYSIDINGVQIKLHHNSAGVSAHSSCMANHLTQDIYNSLKNRVTANGVTLDKCIKTGVENPGHPTIKTVGMTAGDVESYETFKELFDPVISERHNGYPADAVHPSDMDVDKIKDPSVIDEAYVISTRVRSGRSVQGIPLPPSCNKEERRKLEEIVTKALTKLQGELAGDYFPLAGSQSYAAKAGGMTAEEEETLRKEHFLFQEPDSTLLISGDMHRDWPDARGIFHNNDKNALVWLNEEDHLRIISMQMGPDIKAVFSRFAKLCAEVEKVVTAEGFSFAHSEHLGYILTCPSNLGTGLRASMMVRLPQLGKHPDFKKIAGELGIQVRGSAGVDSGFNGVFDLSNAARLGKSEVELINIMIDGVAALIAKEKEMEQEMSETPGGTCPATMGKQCIFRDGHCSMCGKKKGGEEPQTRPETPVESDMCPATMGQRCAYQDGKCSKCGQKEGRGESETETAAVEQLTEPAAAEDPVKLSGSSANPTESNEIKKDDKIDEIDESYEDEFGDSEDQAKTAASTKEEENDNAQKKAEDEPTVQAGEAEKGRGEEKSRKAAEVQKQEEESTPQQKTEDIATEETTVVEEAAAAQKTEEESTAQKREEEDAAAEDAAAAQKAAEEATAAQKAAEEAAAKAAEEAAAAQKAAEEEEAAAKAAEEAAAAQKAEEEAAAKAEKEAAATKAAEEAVAAQKAEEESAAAKAAEEAERKAAEESQKAAEETKKEEMVADLDIGDDDLNLDPAPAKEAPSGNVPDAINVDWFYVGSDGQAVGPITVMEFKSLFGDGKVTKDSHCFRQGMANWEPLRTLSEMFAFVAGDKAGASESISKPTAGADSAVSVQWYYVDNAGGSQGPKTRDEMKNLIESGSITVEQLCFCQGMSGWEALQTLPELYNYVKSAVPAKKEPPANDLDADLDLDDLDF